MPYRNAILPTGEFFRVRISEEALAEWLNDREWLRLQGRVDRPPDIDTGPMRSWLCHPGEQDHPWFKDQRLNIARRVADETKRGVTSSEPVLTVVWGCGPQLLKFLVITESDGGFVIRVKIEDRSTGETTVNQARRIAAEVSPDVAGDLIDDAFAIFDRVADAHGADEHPTITTYLDNETLIRELEIGRAEVAAEFGPLPFNGDDVGVQ